MSSKYYYPNHVNTKHPFMTCKMKVDTQSQWEKTVQKVLHRCNGVHSFRMNDNGEVQISGTADPQLLLEALRKAGRRADVTLFKFGECSSNLFVQTNEANERYLHTAHHSRPAYRAIDNQSNGYGYGYDNRYYDTYGYGQNYHDYHQQQQYGYMHDDSQRSYEYEYTNGGNQIRSLSATQSRSGEDISCCRVM